MTSIDKRYAERNLCLATMSETYFSLRNSDFHVNVKLFDVFFLPRSFFTFFGNCLSILAYACCFILLTLNGYVHSDFISSLDMFLYCFWNVLVRQPEVKVKVLRRNITSAMKIVQYP